MRLTRVESSMIYAVGYERETRTLDVVFLSGGIYRYHDVPEEVYQGLLAAESKGRYMWARVIDVYPYERVRRRPAPKKRANSQKKGEAT